MSSLSGGRYCLITNWQERLSLSGKYEWNICPRDWPGGRRCGPAILPFSTIRGTIPGATDSPDRTGGQAYCHPDSSGRGVTLSPATQAFYELLAGNWKQRRDGRAQSAYLTPAEFKAPSLLNIESMSRNLAGPVATGRMLGRAAEIDDNLNRSRTWTRTLQAGIRFIA
jgi:hypothetical protein